MTRVTKYDTYRVDVVFDGAVEGTDYFENNDLEGARRLADDIIQELAASAPEYDWQVDIYREEGTNDHVELVDSHYHEAETLYNVTFTVQVYADDPGSAEGNARDFVRQHVPEDAKVEVAWLQ